jgi:hypothetical protein
MSMLAYQNRCILGELDRGAPAAMPFRSHFPPTGHYLQLMAERTAERTGSARNRADTVERHNLIASGWFGLTGSLCVRRIAPGVERVVCAPIPRLGKV